MEKMDIIVLDGELVNPGDLFWAPFADLGRLTVYPAPAASEEETIARIGDAKAVLINRTLINRSIMEACPQLCYVGLFSTGSNTVDLVAAAQNGITVCNVPQYSTAAVAQATIALLLALTNHVHFYDTAVRHDDLWQNTKELGALSRSLVCLAGKTMGIIGFGHIGRAVGRIAGALGMRVLACGSRPTAEGEQIGEYVTLETLLSSSDVVSLHCPLLPETRGLLHKGTLALMKPGALLLNTARGGLLSEADVAAALNEGRLGGLGTDVAATEPIRSDNPLLQAKNCLITPHIAWADADTRRQLLDIVLQNLRAFLCGKAQNVLIP